MSRLDSAIRRLQAQRACLDLAAALVQERPGPVLEFGLGNGRTFDHLREGLSGREIFVFERQVAAHPDCIPDADHLFIGDFRDTLPAAAERFRRSVALVHADVGSGDVASTAEIAAYLRGYLPGLLVTGGVAVTDQPMAFDEAESIALPPEVQPGRYFMYRRG